MHYKIASLILNSGQKLGTASDIFVAQPDGYKEALAGKLFILAEVESQKSDGLKAISFIINALNSNYYTSEKIILKEKIETITIESIFEGALTKTNKDFFDFIESEKIKINPYSLNITVGVLYQNELYLSSLGKNKNYLIYKEKIITPKKRGHKEAEPERIEYRAADLSPEKSTNEGISPDKIFSEISGGKIPSSGYFLVINEAMSEYLSPKQLVKITTTLSPAAAMEQIKNTLEQVNSFVSFLGILVKNTSSATLSEEELKKKIQKELEKVNNRPQITSIEEKTEEVLAPAGIINIKKQMDGIFKKPEQQTQSAPKKVNPVKRHIGERIPFMLKDKVFFKKRQSLISFEKISSFFKKIFSGINKILNAITNKPGEDGEYSKENSSRGNKKIKFAAIAIIIIISIFSINLVVTKQRNKNAAILKSFNEKVSTIEKNINKIEADLLYGNNEEAKSLWEENKKLLEEIPEKDKKRETIITLEEKQTNLSEKIRLIVRIKKEDVKIAADFSKLSSSASPKFLTMANSTLSASDESSPTIYKLDTEENIVTASYDLPDIGGMKFLASDNGNIYSLGNSGILKLSSLNQSEKLSIALPEGVKNIGGFKTYNNRAYIVDAKEGQIYRYNQINGSFENKTPWLNSKIDTSNVTDIFINGEIFILRSNGVIEKYLRGQKESFPSLELDEPLTASSRLIIGERMIYILESEKKRLAIFELTGKLSKQYIFEDFSNIKDFYVDEKKKKIYILSEQSVYEMENI